MTEWFIKQGYPESVIDKEMKKFRFSEEGQKSRKVEKGVPFVVRYSDPNEISLLEQNFLE